MTKDDGGSAFPFALNRDHSQHGEAGMSLRTWLAAKEYVALLHDADYNALSAGCAAKAFDRADIFIAEMRRREKETP